MEKNLKKLLDKVVANDDSLAVFANIEQAKHLVTKIGSQRRISSQNKFYGDPLALIRVYADLLDVDKSKRVVVDTLYRERNQPNIGEVEVTQATLLATILLPAFGFKRQSESSDVSGEDAISIRKSLQQINGAFRNRALEAEVISILTDTLCISEVNPGPKPDRKPGEDGSSQILDEGERVAFVLGSFGQLKGNASDGGIRPEAILIRVARRIAEMEQMVAHPENYYDGDRRDYAATAKEVHVPLAAEWRRRANASGDVALAATLDSAKARLKDLVLQIEDKDGYDETRDLILKMARALAKDQYKDLIKDMKSANAMVAGPMADEIHNLLPAAERGMCLVQGRIKSVVSTYYEIKKNGIENLRDVFGVRIIKRLPPNDEKWRTIQTMSNLYKDVVKAVQDHGKYTMEPGRMKDFYGEASRAQLLSSMGREDNGYRTIQDGLVREVFSFVDGKKVSQKISIERQVRDEEAHWIAEFGDASHDFYKKDLRSRPGVSNDNTDAPRFPVFTDGNRTYAATKDGTLADFLAERFRHAPDPTQVFGFPENLAIYRPTSFIDPDLIPVPNQGFATVLMPCDRIRLDDKTDPRRIADPDYRQGIINACHFEASRSFLVELDKELRTSASRRPDAPNGTVVRLHVAGGPL